jgi:hypothetical protein
MSAETRISGDLPEKNVNSSKVTDNEKHTNEKHKMFQDKTKQTRKFKMFIDVVSVL